MLTTVCFSVNTSISVDPQQARYGKGPNTIVLQTQPPDAHLTTLCSIVEKVMCTSEEQKVFREAEWLMFTSL